MAKKKKPSSPSTARLTDHHIPFELLTFEATEKTAREAADKLDQPLNRVIKTLLVVGPSAGCCLVVCPGDREISLKHIGSVLNDKHIQLADRNDVFRKTGCHLGGLGPLAARRDFPVIVDQSILDHTHIIINAGQRGHMLKVNPNDLLKAIEDVRLADHLFVGD